MRTVTVKADLFTALIESARYAADPTLPAWPDAHIPRTEEPVRFNGPHGCTFKDGHHESYPSFVDRCPI